MTSNIKVDDTSLDQVARSCRQAFQQTEQELGRTQQELAGLVNTAMQQVSRAQTLVNQAQAAVTKCEADLRRAEMALRACRAGPRDRDGNPPSCSSQAAAVTRAQAMVAQARQALQQAHQMFEAIKQQADQLRRQQDGFNQAVSNFHNSTGQLVSQAETETKRMRVHLADYLASQSMGGNPGTSGAGRISGAGASATAGPNGPTSSAGMGAGPGVPGFKYACISDITSTDTGVNGPADFSDSFTYDQVCESVNRLQNDLMPLIEQGYSLDQIEQEDIRRGVSPSDPNSLSNTFRVYFGNDAIAIDSNNTVINGRHRIFAARQLGYNYIPVRFI